MPGAGITDAMTAHAEGMGAVGLRGARILDVVEVEDTDRGEVLLVLDDGRVVMLSCDPGYGDRDGITRTPNRWEVVLYEATSTEATSTEAGRRLTALRR